MMFQFPAVNNSLQLIVMSLLCCSLSVQAKDFTKLYTPEQLQRVQAVYGNNIKAVLFEDIAAYLLPAERATLSTMNINFPLYGDSAGLFDFYVNLQNGKITFSALSIKFLDDLAVAFAWYQSKGLDLAEVVAYVNRLYFEEAYLEPPFKALNIPEKAWEQDDFVDDVSQKTLKSAIAFLLIHEVAHWHYKHLAYDSISHRQAQQQEIQSDALALNVMGRMRTIPFGIVPWFMTVGMMSSGNPTTHPLSSDRLMALAAVLESDPAKYISYENRHVYSVATVTGVAKEIRTIAEQMHKQFGR